VTPIAIPADVLAAIYAHAIAAFPEECCGYLTGAAAGAVDATVACRNAQADGEHPIAPERGADTGFVIAGAELLGFARSFDTARPARIVYHSHTNGRAYFSAVDRRMAATPAGPAYPVQHVVIGVAERALPAGGLAPAATPEGPHPAVDPAPPPGPSPGPWVTEVAQFAWSDAARDHVEVARWTGGGPR
jgi:proteasome lid subunit RPN8/RPN11